MASQPQSSQVNGFAPEKCRARRQSERVWSGKSGATRPPRRGERVYSGKTVACWSKSPFLRSFLAQTDIKRGHFQPHRCLKAPLNLERLCSGICSPIKPANLTWFVGFNICRATSMRSFFVGVEHTQNERILEIRPHVCQIHWFDCT